jgi:hypothetical protein
MRKLFLLGIAGAMLVGCQKPAAEQKPAAVSSVAAAATAVPVAANTETAQIPAEEDFEATAENAITPANIEQETAKLEKEIGQ